MRAPAKYPAARIRAEVQAFLASGGGAPFSQVTAVTAVCTALAGRYDAREYRMVAKIQQVLNDRARAGDLIKIPPGERGPDGERNTNRGPVYWIPQAHTAAVAAYGARERARREEAAWWRRIHQDLGELGIVPDSACGEPVCLSAATWDKLLGRVTAEG